MGSFCFTFTLSQYLLTRSLVSVLFTNFLFCSSVLQWDPPYTHQKSLWNSFFDSTTITVDTLPHNCCCCCIFFFRQPVKFMPNGWIFKSMSIRCLCKLVALGRMNTKINEFNCKYSVLFCFWKSTIDSGRKIVNQYRSRTQTNVATIANSIVDI